MRRAILAVLLSLALAPGALAGVEPSPGAGDPRMRTAPYDPDQVVELTGDLGFQMTIEFADDERIENVGIGDGPGWQITPNRKASLLFLKPVEQAAPTNLIVVTDRRRYAFELKVRKGPAPDPSQVIYALRFDYPPPPPPPPIEVVEVKAPPVVEIAVQASPPPQVVNAAYSYEGSIRTLPARVFDDGKSTYFQFSETDEYPAVFIVDLGQEQAVVNTVVRDGYLIVDRVAPAFVLKRGSQTTRLYNDGWREPQPGPLSPKARPPAKRGLFGR